MCNNERALAKGMLVTHSGKTDLTTGFQNLPHWVNPEQRERLSPSIFHEGSQRWLQNSIIGFAKKYIVEGGHLFQNYAVTDDCIDSDDSDEEDKLTIKDYILSLL